MASNDMPCSPGLRRPLRTEAEALADVISKKYQMDMGCRMIAVTHDQFDLIIRALRAYKPTGEE